MYNKFILIIFIPAVVAQPSGTFPIFFSLPSKDQPSIPWKEAPHYYPPTQPPAYQDSVPRADIKPQNHVTPPTPNQFRPIPIEHMPQPPIDRPFTPTKRPEHHNVGPFKPVTSPISNQFQPIPVQHQPQHPKYPFLIPKQVPDICGQVQAYCGYV